MKLAQYWDDGVLDDLRVIEILRKLYQGFLVAHHTATWVNLPDLFHPQS